MSPALVGLAVALPQECASLTRMRLAPGACIRLDDTRLLCLAGAGPAQAHAAARRLLDAGATALVSWGCAGALDPALPAGTLCLPASIFDEAGERLPVSEGWRQHAQQRLPAGLVTSDGVLLSVTRIITGAAAKRALRARHDAVAVDMESAAIATAARGAGVPFLAVRAIADPATRTLPDAIARAMDVQGAVNVAVLIRHALLHPAQWLPLAAVACDFRAALRTLKAAAASFTGPPAGSADAARTIR